MGMKTISVTKEQPELRKLVEEAYGGAEVILSYGEKMVRLQRYEPDAGGVEFDLEEDSPELEAELLKGLHSSHSPYSREDLEAIAERVRHQRSPQ